MTLEICTGKDDPPNVPGAIDTPMVIRVPLVLIKFSLPQLGLLVQV